MLRKILAASTLAAGLAAQAFTGAGPAAASTMTPDSSGGGCSGSVAVGLGWAFSSCISAQNTVVMPNGYITASGSRGSSCTIWVDLIKNGVVSSHRANPCSGPTGSMVFGVNTAGAGTYFTGIYVVVNNTISSEVISPNEFN